MIWKQQPKHSNYQVSSSGDVCHFNSTTNRKTRLDKDGYLRLNVHYFGKVIAVKVHTFVAETFLENPNNLKTVNHKDGNKNNNKVENLEWLSAGDNTKHGFQSGLQPMCMPVAINGKMYYSKREAERQTGLKRYKL